MVPTKRLGKAMRFIMDLEADRAQRMKEDRMYITMDRQMEAMGTADGPGMESGRKMKSLGYYCNLQKKWVWQKYAWEIYEAEELTRGAGLLC